MNQNLSQILKHVNVMDGGDITVVSWLFAVKSSLFSVNFIIWGLGVLKDKVLPLGHHTFSHHSDRTKLPLLL